MSPEQFDSDEIDQRSDIYSLGLVTAEMLTGAHPIGEKVALADLLKWLREPAKPVAGMERLPPAVQAFVTRCLERNPDDRFASMDEVLSALDALEAEPASGSTRLVAILFVAALILVALTVYFWPVSVPADEPILVAGEGETLVLLVPRTSTFWTATANFAAAAAEDLDHRLVVYSAQEEGALMGRQAHLALEDNPGAIIVQDFEQQGAAIARLAERRGVDFYAINNVFEQGVPSNAQAAIRPDDEGTGYQLARFLVARALERRAASNDAPDSPVVLLAVHGREGEAAAEDRRRGLERALSEHADFVVVEDLQANWMQDQAREAVRAGLREHPAVEAIWCAGDAMALGTIEASVRAGRDPGTDLFVGGVDWTRDALLAIQEGTLSVSFGGHFMEAGWAVVLAAAERRSLDPIVVDTPMRPATEDNVNDVLALLRTGAFQRIDFQALVRRVRGGDVDSVLDPEQVLRGFE